jgi:hypothetical protein
MNHCGAHKLKENTKFLQQLDLMGFLHKGRDLIAEYADIDLLSLFHQIGARIMEILGERKL